MTADNLKMDTFFHSDIKQTKHKNNVYRKLFE